MKTNIVGIEHFCNVVRRDLEEEFKELKLFFLHHRDQERDAMINKQKKLLVDHPSGREILDLLYLNKDKNVSEFLGLCVHQPEGFFKAFTAPSYTAVICINYERYISEENALHYIYHICWHALDLLTRLKIGAITIEKDQKVIMPHNDRLELTQKNLTADVFGAITMANKGSEDFIEKLAKERSQEVLTRVLHHNPAFYPYPIAHEACSLIYGDMKDMLKNSKKPISMIMEMSEEVSMTYDNTSISKWCEFAEPAQEMAWMGMKPEDILGYALYACDDAYLRATAHQIYENLGKQPTILTNIKTYNPFASNEENERLHKAKYEELFKDTLAQVAADGQVDRFINAAKKMNGDLIGGQFSGWCSYAFTKAHDAMIDPDKAGDFDHVINIFQKSQAQTPWNTLREISQLVLKIRRQNGTVNMPGLLNMLNKAEKFQPFAKALEITPNVSSHIFNTMAEGTEAITEKIQNLSRPNTVFTSKMSEIALEDEVEKKPELFQDKIVQFEFSDGEDDHKF